MPTNDERRQVAARLRDIAACKDYGDYLGTDDFVSTIKRAFRAKVPIPRTDKAYLRAIADLIEPEPERTCRIIWNETDKTWECDSCGGAVGFKEVCYCESCGAKVVE